MFVYVVHAKTLNDHALMPLYQQVFLALVYLPHIDQMSPETRPAMSLQLCQLKSNGLPFLSQQRFTRARPYTLRCAFRQAVGAMPIWFPTESAALPEVNPSLTP